MVRVRAQRRAAVGGLAGQGVLLGGVLPRGRREHPDPRWHRVHVGAPRAPLLQAGEVVRAALRRPDLPPRAPRPADRNLISAILASPDPVYGPTGRQNRWSWSSWLPS